MITRDFLKQFSFRVFRDSDYNGFAGVQSPVPLIAETDEFLVIIDGDRCEVYTDDCESVEICESVSELPY